MVAIYIQLITHCLANCVHSNKVSSLFDPIDLFFFYSKFKCFSFVCFIRSTSRDWMPWWRQCFDSRLVLHFPFPWSWRPTALHRMSIGRPSPLHWSVLTSWIRSLRPPHAIARWSMVGPSSIVCRGDTCVQMELLTCWSCMASHHFRCSKVLVICMFTQHKRSCCPMLTWTS